MTKSSDLDSEKLARSRKRTYSQIVDKLLCPCKWLKYLKEKHPLSTRYLLGYFEEVPSHNWDLNHFDQQYVNHVKVTKQIAHLHFSLDLDTLSEAFPDDEKILRIIKKLKKEVKVMTQQYSVLHYELSKLLFLYDNIRMRLKKILPITLCGKSMSYWIKDK